jgi:hypothetical protein
MRGIDYTNAFLIKVWLTMNPIKGLVIGVTFMILLNSYILLLNERVTNIDTVVCFGNDSNHKVHYYRDAVWLTIITFCTVGFGDYYPISNSARYIMIITAICG